MKTKMKKGPKLQDLRRDNARLDEMERLLCEGGILTYLRDGMRCEFFPGFTGQRTLRPFLDDRIQDRKRRQKTP